MWNFLPLSEQYDSGLGVTADAFHEAATHVRTAPTFLNQHLPVGFLLRHAIELYLKSVIFVVHRRFEIAWGDRPFGTEPQISVGGKMRPLFGTHSIGQLYEYVAELFTRHADIISATSRTDWESAFIPEIAEAVARIEVADQRSTLFRYPESGNEHFDSDKSAIKKYTVEQLAALPSLAPGATPVKAFLVYDDQDEVVASYGFDSTATQDILADLERVAEHFSTVHFAVRMELARGA